MERASAMSVHVVGFERLPEQTPPQADVECVLPGDEISVEAGFVRGHGTVLDGGKLTATVAGLVERVNKLVAVRPVRSRYNPEIGDVVVGRVVETAQKRWKVDVNSRQNASLLLSAVNLPGGVQRRRTYEDELNMRSFFTEDDLISAEVQEIRHDGSVSLHTRSLKYGKLGPGVLVIVTPQLVKRSQKHFHDLEQIGVRIILGNNGYIWVQPSRVALTIGLEGEDGDNEKMAEPDVDTINPIDERQRVARVRNAVEVLDRMFISIHAQTIMDVFEASQQLDISLHEMQVPHVGTEITAVARERREAG